MEESTGMCYLPYASASGRILRPSPFAFRPMPRPRLALSVVISRSAASLLIAVSLVACDGRTPTAADVRTLDARQAERGAALLLGDEGGVTTYLVDGVASTREAAQAIPSAEVAAVNVNKTMTNGAAATEIRIITKAGAARGLLAAEAEGPRIVVRGGATTGTPLIFIDGRRATKTEMDALQPSGILSVEVLKGEAAVREYGEAAKDGVIKVTTKAPTGR
jgi:outer membrane receptor protein involved in Fe transport